MLRPAFFLPIFLFTICVNVKAQRGKFKYGDIPMDEMTMTHYEKDSSAAAVVLLNTGYFNEKEYKFFVHKRIKILKSAGTGYGNFTLRVRNRSVIKASTFNLENGQIVEYKLKNSEIHDEEITDGLTVQKLFLENVKEGSVVEIKYSHFGLPFDWDFQEIIPVKYNELLVEESPHFIFELSHFGNYQLDHLGDYHWTGTDIPAFLPEPFMNSTNNYLRRVEFELEKITLHGYYYEDFTTTWDEVGKYLMDSPYFGALLNAYSGFLNSKAKELKALDISTEEKIKAAFDYVRDQIKWNGADGIFASTQLKKKFTQDHTGSVAEINMGLISLLRRMDIQASPIVLSTKDNGYLKVFKPSINKLNYVVCIVEYEGKHMLLDASPKYAIPGVLPVKCLNGNGWVVNEVAGRWQSLEAPIETFEKSFAQITLQDNGTCEAVVLKKRNQFDYLTWKNDFDEAGNNESKYHRAFDEKLREAEIKEYSMKEKSDKLQVSERYRLDLSSQVDDLGSEIVLNPFVFSFDTENPFKSDERLSDVDLGHKFGIDRKIMVKFPETLVLLKAPEPVSVTTDDDQALFKFSVITSNNSVTLSYQMIVTDPIISVSDYPVFKVFYSLMIDKLNESLIFKRTN